ncbi:MAG: glycosyltransferase family 2 protein [Anaerolineae bacterium]|nr:glycosyltransferase family 2 protein [Anaerolineae bacterium]
MILPILVFIFWICVAAFLWTYFGYPLFMYLLARGKRTPPVTAPDSLPTLTLLIPAHNEADVIRRKLNNSLTLNYPRDRLQILVVDDGSSDGTPDIVREFAVRGVTLIEQPFRGGKMAAVNTGFAHATGEIVVLSDASPSYESESLRILARRFADPTVGVVVGTLAVWDAATAVAKPAGLYWRYEAALRRWESKTGSTVAVHGNMFAIRRALFRPLRTGIINDEFSIAMEVLRQGYRVVYEPDAISYDDASATMSDEFNRRVRINAGRYQALFSAGYLKAPTPGLAFRLFSHKLLRPLTPVLMLLILLANLLAVLLSQPMTGHFLEDALLLRGWWGGLILLGQLAFYGLALAGWLAERRGRHYRLLNVIYFFVSSNLAALVGLWRWARGTQHVTWQKRTADS